MRVEFKDDELRKIYEQGVEKGKPRYGKEIVKAFIKKIDLIVSIRHSTELAKYQSLHFELLTKEIRYKGMHSIRINDKYRLIVKIIKHRDGADTFEIREINDLTDYH
jgi:toxin HigB-1